MDNLYFLIEICDCHYGTVYLYLFTLTRYPFASDVGPFNACAFLSQKWLQRPALERCFPLFSHSTKGL